jgi:RNA polymerase sigma factor (sigma-70 family)
MDAEAGSGPSDEELMKSLQKGRESALSALMVRWEKPLKRFLFRVVGSTSEAEDLAQDVFVRIYAKRATYREGAKFSTWCFSIASNLAKNRLRWWRVRPTVSLEAWIDAGGENADESQAGEPAAFKVVQNERIGAVQTAIAALPLKLRTVLVLFEYEEHPVAEIANALGCSPKTVENRLFRARQLLRQSLQNAP